MSACVDRVPGCQGNGPAIPGSSIKKIAYGITGLPTDLAGRANIARARRDLLDHDAALAVYNI